MAGPNPGIADIVLAAGNSVAVVGMAKNCGKTVTLGAILEGLAVRGMSVGVASAGRDGEDVDAVTTRPKPPIRLPAGALFATAERLAAKARTPMERVAVTSHSSALGRLVVYRTLAPGTVEVGGGTSAAAVREVVALMRELGASFVALDGAAGRRFSCAPSLVEATILATGAAAAETMQRVVRRTAAAARVLMTPAWRNQAAARVLRVPISRTDVVLVRRDGSFARLCVPSVLLRPEEVAGMVAQDHDAVVIGGALTGGLLRALLRRHRASPLTAVVRDATKILAEPGDIEWFRSAGGRLAVIHPIRLAAVTTNPAAPDGRLFDPEAFVEGVARAVAPLPTFDVVAGLSRNLPQIAVAVSKARVDQARACEDVKLPGEGGVA
ncbi:MAG: hypothetical protein ACM3X3_00800 [Betaproteobacteria bacterium]